MTPDWLDAAGVALYTIFGLDKETFGWKWWTRTLETQEFRQLICIKSSMVVRHV